MKCRNEFTRRMSYCSVKRFANFRGVSRYDATVISSPLKQTMHPGMYGRYRKCRNANDRVRYELKKLHDNWKGKGLDNKWVGGGFLRGVPGSSFGQIMMSAMLRFRTETSGLRVVVHDGPFLPDDNALWSVVVDSSGRRPSCQVSTAYSGQHTVDPTKRTALLSDRNDLVVSSKEGVDGWPGSTHNFLCEDHSKYIQFCSLVLTWCRNDVPFLHGEQYLACVLATLHLSAITFMQHALSHLMNLFNGALTHGNGWFGTVRLLDKHVFLFKIRPRPQVPAIDDFQISWV